MANPTSHPGTDRSDLSAWLDGELPDDDLARLEEELARDPELKAELDALETVVSFVRATAPAHAPTGFTDRLMARIEKEERPASRGWRRPFGVPVERWAVGLAAAAAIALIVVRAKPLDPTRGDTSQTLSPAALEQTPSPTGEAPARKDGPPALPPVARERRPRDGGGEPAKGIAGAPTTQAGEKTVGEVVVTSDGEAPAVVVQGTDAPFLPTDDGPLPAMVYTVKSPDPSMKREVLATVARYGEVLTAEGVAATEATMTAPTERLRVLLRQDQLAQFQQDLEASGFSVRYWFTGQLAGRDTVEIEVLLQQLSPDGGATPP